MTTKVVFADSPSVDAFGRARVSTPFTLFDHKNVYNNSTESFNEITSGTSANITFNVNASAQELTVGSAAGDMASRQSRPYVPYIPGKSQQVILTGRFAASKSNVSQRIGLFDSLNGFFLHDNGTNMGVVVRSSTSGSAVNTRVAQSEWNIDKLDGTGISGVTLDFTKANIYIIDFQWLGVGRIRFCIDHKGLCVPFHEFINDNVREVPYTQTASLPVKYEIENDATALSDTTMTEICNTVVSEGGFQPPGFEHFVSTEMALKEATSTADIKVLAYRLKSSFAGKPNRKTAELIHYDAYCEDNACLFKIVHAQTPASSTATWTSVSDESAVEYSTDISTIGAGSAGCHNIDGIFVPAASLGQASDPGSGGKATLGNKHRMIYQNIDSTISDIMVVIARSQTGTGNVAAGMTFVEFD
jgi:hypothetical protein